MRKTKQIHLNQRGLRLGVDVYITVQGYDEHNMTLLIQKPSGQEWVNLDVRDIIKLPPERS